MTNGKATFVPPTVCGKKKFLIEPDQTLKVGDTMKLKLLANRGVDKIDVMPSAANLKKRQAIKALYV